MKYILGFLVLCASLLMQAQQFTSSFTLPPSQDVWAGDTAHFELSHGMWRLQNAGGQAPSSLVAAMALDADSLCQWYLDFRYTLRTQNPSSSNHMKWYLAAMRPTFDVGDNYYLQVGGADTDDALHFVHQNGTQKKTLWKSQQVRAKNDSVFLNIRVLYEAPNWHIWLRDTRATSQWAYEGAVYDTSFNTAYYSGFVCNYTSSNNVDAFWLDSVAVGPLYVDRVAPYWELVRPDVLQANFVDVRFSEPMDSLSVHTLSNYFCVPLVPIQAIEALGQNEYRLHLGDTLQHQTNYTFYLNGVLDKAGNPSFDSLHFMYETRIEPHAGALVFSEILADVSPVVGLPAHDFIELYNRSDAILQLEGCVLYIDERPLVFPAVRLGPGEHLLCVHDAAMAAYSKYGLTVSWADFPDMSNSGARIHLENTNAEVLDVLSFTRAAYRHTYKEDGGWSLEREDMAALCDGMISWKPSIHWRGGTPGQSNSVATTREVVALEGTRVYPRTPTHWALYTTQRVDITSVNLFIEYQGARRRVDSVWVDTLRPEVIHFCVPSVDTGKVYTLHVDAWQNCLGAEGVSQSFQLGVPEEAQVQDIVINEILFNPEVGGSDFIELYNRSTRVIDLATLFVGNMKNEALYEWRPLTAERLLFPGDYMVYTEDSLSLVERYQVATPRAIHTQVLPNWPDDKQTVLLFNTAGIIDSFTYKDDFHSELLSSVDGVSLERVQPSWPSNLRKNWQSAASRVGFATPTYQNTAFYDANEPASSIWELERGYFSPNGDGYEDRLPIRYASEGAYAVTIAIYTVEGRRIRTLSTESLWQGGGVLFWDGLQDDGMRAVAGLYVVLVHYDSLKGKRGFWKASCVLQP